jgi:hypothetical protein
MAKFRVKFDDRPTTYDFDAPTAREALLGMAYHLGRSGTAYAHVWEWDGKGFDAVGPDPGFGQPDGAWTLNVPSPPSQQPNAQLVAEDTKGAFGKTR